MGTTVRVNESCCVPCTPSGGGGIPRDRSYELGSQVIVVIVIRITHHREIPSPVDTGDENWIDITVSIRAGKLYPRGVVLFYILFGGTLWLNVFPVSRILGQKGGALSSRELERDTAARLKRPGAHV